MNLNLELFVLAEVKETGEPSTCRVLARVFMLQRDGLGR